MISQRRMDLELEVSRHKNELEETSKKYVYTCNEVINLMNKIHIELKETKRGAIE